MKQGLEERREGERTLIIVRRLMAQSCNTESWWIRYHGDEASDELEVLEMIGVDVGGRIDLQTVVVLASILKQTVHGVQNLVREQEEPFPEKYNRWTRDS